MALSGVRDQAETATDLVTGALQKLFIIPAGESPTSEDTALGLVNLRRMLRTWAIQGVRLWLNEQQTVTLATDTATYTLSPRTLEVTGAFRRTSGNDTPITIYTREQYNRLPNKTASGEPYVIWLDRQYNQTVCTVYPVPSGATSTLSLSTKRQIQDVTALSENVELPPEWSEAIVYNLAVRMAPDFATEARADISQMAKDLFETLSGQDREGSMFMGPSRYA